MGPTEITRRRLVAAINSQVESENNLAERRRLEAKWGQVWNTDELCKDFDVQGFAAPFVVVRENATGAIGTLTFQDWPRFYFSFQSQGR